MECVSNLKRQSDHQSDSSLPAKKFANEASVVNKANNHDHIENLESCEISKIPHETNYVRATEHGVGITEYLNNLPGFNGILKERYSDFIVNEIDTKQNVVRLTNLDKPIEPALPNKLNDLLNEETLSKLEELSCQNTECSEVMIEVTNMDKNTRKEIHVGLRKSYNNIDSTTEDKDGKKFIIVKKITQKGNRFQPPAGGNYTHFVLYKENKDTIDTINTIASFLRVQSKIFSYAGTKDKRAKTSQLASAYRIPSAKLLGLNKRFQMIKVGNLEFKPEQLKLGDLSGNFFTIVLRQLEGDEAVIEKAMDSLSSKGFINYYGMQRFGTSCIPTHVVGRALLCGDWKMAINLILAPKAEDDKELCEAKKIWNETRNANKALENLRRKSSIEAKLLIGIASNNKKDLVNALNAVPRNMRLMYIHSYQSFIWNQVVSKRIQKYGLKVLVGDLLSSDINVPEENLDISREDDRKLTLSNKVKFVTAEDLESIKITEVLIPLPGHSVVFPKNETKEWYEECLKSDGMSLDNFKSKTKTYSLSGDYRKFIILPEDVKWEIISYADNTQPLALSDLDRLTGTTLPNSSDNGPLKALKVEFKLPSSSYATMALREVQKNDSCKKL